MSIYTKLFEIQKQNLLLTADAENPFYKNKYISIENIMKTFKPLLEQQKILLYHIVTGDSVSTYVRDIEDSDGEPVVSIFPLNSSLDAQKKGAEITYGKRYNLVALFCVVEDDDDGNFASGKTAVAKASYTSTPQGTSYATKSAVEEKADWVNEKEVDKLFDDMIDGTLPLAS